MFRGEFPVILCGALSQVAEGEHEPTAFRHGPPQ